MIDAYLKYHEFSWAPATLRAARYTLGKYMNPPPQYAEQLWKDLEHLAPYARNTAWIRCAHYYEWLIENRTVHGENQFKAFAKKHKRLFRSRSKKLKNSWRLYQMGTSDGRHSVCFMVRNDGQTQLVEMAWWSAKGIRFDKTTARKLYEALQRLTAGSTRRLRRSA